MARGSLMVKYREMQVRTLSYPYGWVAQLVECGEMGVSKSLPQWAKIFNLGINIHVSK